MDLRIFGDGSDIRPDRHNGTTWALQGQTPVVRATGRRLLLYMISAVSTQRGVRFMPHEGSVCAKVIMRFLKRLTVNAEKSVFPIVDGYSIRKVNLVKSYVDGLVGKHKLLYLALDAHIWSRVKGYWQK